MLLARADFENLNETEIRVEASRVQCAMLEYQLGVKRRLSRVLLKPACQ